MDVDPGESTNRTVYTFVGGPDAIVEGALNAAKAAYPLIDMTKHKGMGGHFNINVALTHLRMARQGEVIPKRDLNDEESSTNEQHEQNMRIHCNLLFLAALGDRTRDPHM